MNYQMTTINSGLRIRLDHNTFASVLTTVPSANVVLKGSEKWIAPADGSEVKAGDIWIKVTYNGFTGWAAHTHKGVAYCRDLQEIAPPPVVTNPEFPDYFILESPTGERVRYARAAL